MVVALEALALTALREAAWLAGGIIALISK